MSLVRAGSSDLISGAQAIRLNLWRLAVALVLIGLLSACATPKSVSIPGQDFWSGRLAVRIDSMPPQSFSAGFELRGSPENGELQLSSPLGNSLAQVVWTPLGAQLRQGESVTQFGSLDVLTTQLSGTALPVAAMFAWLKGQASSAAGWQPDLGSQAEGKITAVRSVPEPRAELRIVFEP